MLFSLCVEHTLYQPYIMLYWPYNFKAASLPHLPSFDGPRQEIEVCLSVICTRNEHSCCNVLSHQSSTVAIKCQLMRESSFRRAVVKLQPALSALKITIDVCKMNRVGNIM